MSTSLKRGEKEKQAELEEGCRACGNTGGELLISCGRLHCSTKIHIHCAIRPERSQLHFCSVACALEHFRLL